MKLPTEAARERFAGKRVTVVGLAREGTSLVRFLAAVGARVTANDRADASSLSNVVASLANLPVQFVLGGHPRDAFADADVVFVSPGVPRQLPALLDAQRLGIPLSSETQLFLELCRGHVVGITGSSGKTTTTALVGEMLRRGGVAVHVGGNIGLPLIERLDEIGPDDWVVLELSSFQLEALPYSPPVAAILNITPNHLDRHGDMESYVAAKANIVRHQRSDDLAILNADDPIARGIQAPGRSRWFSIEQPVDGCYLDGERIVLRKGSSSEVVCGVADVRLRGRHNLANVAAAIAVASAVGIDAGAMRAAVAGFQGVAHRLELVGKVGGVAFCNDSIATSPERSIASMNSFSEPIILIAGGRNKGLPFDDWAREIRRRARALVLMGESADAIERAVAEADGPTVPMVLRARSMDDAVQLAHEVARPGEVVLLAPGCTSFDMFKDYEERGERFRECVRKLASRDGRRTPNEC